MKPVRILIVEDDSVLLTKLTESYLTVFTSHGYQPTIEHAQTAAEARQLAKAAKSNPYDFVSLDVNLGDAILSGLDVLETLKRFHSAWMVAVLTGVESDITVDKTMGKTTGERLRKQLRRDAYSRFPAERLLVVEKPSVKIGEDDALKLLSNRLEQIALVYEEVGRLRYVFRPIEVASLERIPAPKGVKAKRKFIETTARHWQIRYNCGEIRTLPDMAGFRTLHYLLSGGNENSVTPEETLAIEPKNESLGPECASNSDPVAGYFEAQGIAWNDLSSDEQDKLVRAALSLKFERYRELRGYQNDKDILPTEEAELTRITQELGPLSGAAETAYLRMRPAEETHWDADEASPAVLAQQGLQMVTGDYDNVGRDRRGQDSQAAQLFRARMKRVKDYLRENGFSEFAQHIEDYLQSTGANWSYSPPTGVEWTT